MVEKEASIASANISEWRAEVRDVKPILRTFFSLLSSSFPTTMVPSRPSLVATSLSRWASSSAPRAKTARPPKSQLQTPKASGSSQTTSSASTGSSSKPTSWSSPSKRQQRTNVVQQSRFNAAHPSHNQLSKASPSRTKGTAAAPSSSTPTHSRVTLNSTTYPAASGAYSSPTSSTAGEHVKGGENKSLWQSWKNIPPRNRMAVGVVAGSE
jgi:hypothetical protein